MRKYVMSFAASLEHKPEHPERTARRSRTDWDVEFQVWPNRASMAKTIRMQEKGCEVGHAWKIWRASVPLSTTEGY
jgi:hypothetical protein